MLTNRREIMPQVFLTYLPAKQFKTCLLSAYLVAPLKKETASYNALLPAVLRRGTMRCPNMESLSAELDKLYGAQIDNVVRKKGERQCIGFVANAIDDAYTPHGEKLLEPLCRNLGELFLDPLTHNGRFLAEYVESEKQNLIDAIRAIRNDKRDWADVRLMQEMCAAEPYGVLRLGDEASVKKINNQKLYQHYQNLLAQSRMEIIYCGSAEEKRVERALQAAFAALPRGKVMPCPPILQYDAPAEPAIITEEMDVQQGKLAMGWRCSSTDVPAMIMANLLFGGTSNAKLFLNVREKMSLCYYASSSFVRSKGIMTVSSGIEVKDYDTAVQEILRQWEMVKEGKWEDWEWDGAMATILSGLDSLPDSQGAMENFYLGQVVTGQDSTSEELAEMLRQVTAERVRSAACMTKLDTVYFLRGKEET